MITKPESRKSDSRQTYAVNNDNKMKNVKSKNDSVNNISKNISSNHI